MGTLALRRRPGLSGVSALWTETHPDLVAGIHRDYVAAGADLIVTNTFLATAPWLRAGALSVEALNRAAVALARDAAGRKAFVAGSVGPLPERLDAAAATAVYAEQIAALVGAGVDAVLVETMSSVEQLRQVLETARCDVPVIASMTMPRGAATRELAHIADEFDVAAVGVNCCDGPETVLALVESLAGETERPIVARPSAGLPDASGAYPFDDATMEDYARRLVDSGARVVGGCCGTTPSTIAALVRTREK